ncbi:molybdopterin oxidoreductase family protein [Sulfurovum sp. AR]|uniref:molybdopterin oxidoreductase family protein n=1 Tax=Sulfurovum sp. AR TaxID=1165841 RepID=UPI00025C4837|nr:molybdopterin-dependent oxidoreductase [Sulfurovum sp. AR]EIF50743.1 molybdopterin oxidoreductase [Sulfurovum sp. AR]
MSQTVCAYCGVGCKFELINHKLKGVKDYPSNQGMSCAKGISQSQTIHTNRLLEVHYRDSIEESFRPSTYEDSFQLIAEKIKQSTHPDRIGFYLSGQMLNEDYYVANKLAKGFVGTANCDTNSRTCMASAVVGYKKSFGMDYVPVRMEEIEHCHLMILIGANTAEAHVVLHNKIKKAQKKGLKVVVIDPRFTLTAQSADLYLPLKVGTDIDLLNLLAIKLIKEDQLDHDFIKEHSNHFNSYKEKLLALDEKVLLKSTQLSEEIFEAFYRLFKQSENIITAWTMGINQSVQGVDKNLAINNLHILTGQINKKGSGPLSLTGQPNAMGGREVGGLSTTLAVHLDYNEENCQKVADFWKSNKIPKKNGLTAFEMIEKANQKELDILIICHTDPVYHLPHRRFVEEAFKKIPLVIEINAYQGSETSKFAHILIPAVPFGEKEGTQTNLDRTLTRVVAFEAKDGLLQDWEVFAQIGKHLGHEKSFDFRSSKEVFEEYQEMTKLSYRKHLDIYKAQYDDLEHTPFIWGETLYDQNHFLTPDRKANLFFIENQNLSEQPSQAYPFILLTGRTRDQWHTGSKTIYSENLLKYKALEFVEINQKDAAALQLNEGEIVKIVSSRGELRAKVVFAELNAKTIFIPISHRDINYLTDDTLDPLSKEPDYNHSAVRIEKIESMIL